MAVISPALPNHGSPGLASGCSRAMTSSGLMLSNSSAVARTRREVAIGLRPGRRRRRLAIFGGRRGLRSFCSSATAARASTAIALTRRSASTGAACRALRRRSRSCRRRCRCRLRPVLRTPPRPACACRSCQYSQPPTAAGTARRPGGDPRHSAWRDIAPAGRGGDSRRLREGSFAAVRGKRQDVPQLISIRAVPAGALSFPTPDERKLAAPRLARGTRKAKRALTAALGD